jgi:hypothetical protein
MVWKLDNLPLCNNAVLTFKGPMTALVIIESNAEWPYVD